MFDEIIFYFGGVVALAQALGVSASAVSQWRVNGISAEGAIEIERLSGGLFKAVDIREGQFNVD